MKRKKCLGRPFLLKRVLFGGLFGLVWFGLEVWFGCKLRSSNKHQTVRAFVWDGSHLCVAGGSFHVQRADEMSVGVVFFFFELSNIGGPFRNSCFFYFLIPLA